MQKFIPVAVFLTAASLLLSYSPAEPDAFLEKPPSKVDIDGKTLKLKQISETGDVVDSFRIAK